MEVEKMELQAAARRHRRPRRGLKGCAAAVLATGAGDAKPCAAPLKNCVDGAAPQP
ncbi:hypothetical protein I553_10641, partial [Mycobacterium xenopi 4042]